MRSEWRPALVLLALLTAIMGVAYPLLVTGIARVAFPGRASGSPIYRSGRPIGSDLVGQEFDRPEYFWGRLSATTPEPYNAAASAGSNYGPLNPALLAEARARIEALRSADPQARGPVPVDLVTSSASGLDPDISPAAAGFQIARVARARGMDPRQVGRLVEEHTQPRTWGLLGEPRVNVLELNLALDAAARAPADSRRR